MIRTKVFKSIAEISQDEWDKVFPDVLESYRFFRTLDESGGGQFSFLYITVYENKTIIGATACFLVNYELDTTIRGPLKKLALYVKKFFPNIFSVKALVCGIPMAQGRIGIRGESEKVVGAICKRMERIAKKEKAPVVAFKDFDPSYEDILIPVIRKGYQRLRSLPNTVRDVSFADFEEYLKTLSAATRYDLRRKFKKSAAHKVHLEMETHTALSDDALAEAYALYLQTVNLHEVAFEVMPEAFFRNISRNMPKEVKYFLWRVDGKLAAFSFCLLKDHYFIDYYLGFDYSIAYEHHLYFIKFRDVMKWCIENKVRKYEFGTTDYEPKKRLGFKFIPLYIYAKHRNIFFDPVFRVISSILQPDNFDPILKKMKKGL